VPVEVFVFDAVLVPVLALGGGVVDMIGFEMVSAAEEQSATDLSFLMYEDVYSQCYKNDSDCSRLLTHFSLLIYIA